ncbi:MAG: LuxR C-terminal-related transcriptional regulator, partial [Mycobacterium sp.]
MVAAWQLFRPRDADALRAALRSVRSQTKMPVLFGGEVHGDTLLLTEFLGTRTASMRGLVVHPRCGLGGAAVVTATPLAVSDYRTAATITHDYDSPVLTEGLLSVLAVPVIVDGQARAVLYSARREAAPVGGRTANVMMACATQLAGELAIRDEVDRRLRLREARIATSRGDVAAAEQVRAVHADLLQLASDASTPAPLRNRLRALAENLAESGDAKSGGALPAVSHLSGRERDVLAQVALGCSNRETAQRLSLQPETVKSYLRSATAKLGARTRHQA